jgi:hypothetical protein
MRRRMWRYGDQAWHALHMHHPFACEHSTMPTRPTRAAATRVQQRECSNVAAAAAVVVSQTESETYVLLVLRDLL